MAVSQSGGKDSQAMTIMLSRTEFIGKEGAYDKQFLQMCSQLRDRLSLRALPSRVPQALNRSLNCPR